MTADTKHPRSTSRPSICLPPDQREAVPAGTPARRWSRQPRLGVAGLLLVVPVAVLLAVGAGGPEPSLVVLEPLVTFALPVVAMIAFWWEDWPGTRLGPDWAGWVDTVLIVIAAIALTLLGEVVVGQPGSAAIFDPAPGPGEPSTFPSTMPIAGGAFIAMLEVTLVCEGWPFRRYLSPIAGGVVALVVSWLVAIALYAVLLGGRPFRGGGHGVLEPDQLGVLLTLAGAWQVWLFVLWRWPFAGMRRRLFRLVAGNAVVVGGTALAYFVLCGWIGLSTSEAGAAAGLFVAGGLVVGMLFEGALPGRWPPARKRAVSLLAAVVCGAVLYAVLVPIAASVSWGRGSAEDWIGHVGLNAVSASIILHVAIGRRWPFTN